MMEVIENIVDKETFKLAVVVQRTDHKKISSGRCWHGMSDGVQGTVGCIGDCWTAVGTSNPLTENIRCLNKSASALHVQWSWNECFQNGQ